MARLLLSRTRPATNKANPTISATFVATEEWRGNNRYETTDHGDHARQARHPDIEQVTHRSDPRSDCHRAFVFHRIHLDSVEYRQRLLEGIGEMRPCPARGAPQYLREFAAKRPRPV
jgi:hypothetical protein